jgi:hypothetical protein
MCFINVLFKVITYLKFYKRCFLTDDLQKHFCIIGWCLVRHKNPQAKFFGLKTPKTVTS